LPNELLHPKKTIKYASPKTHTGAVEVELSFISEPAHLHIAMYIRRIFNELQYSTCEILGIVAPPTLVANQ
jgi:hypothetical protein